MEGSGSCLPGLRVRCNNGEASTVCVLDDEVPKIISARNGTPGSHDEPRSYLPAGAL